MALVDPDRLRPKVDHIRERLRRLRAIGSRGFDAFQHDDLVQDAAVRNLQTSVEAVLDMANHVVTREGLGTPTSYREAIDLLIEDGLLPEERGEAFRGTVGFRNRAVHLYDEIEAEEVFRIIEEDLADFDIFISAVVQRYFEES